MSEAKRSLRQILTELHELLDASPDIRAESRAALLKAAGEIQTALDEDRGAQTPSLGDQLGEAIEKFEEEHPQITQVVGRLAAALSDLGI